MAPDDHSYPLDETLPPGFKLLPGEHVLQPIQLQPRRVYEKVPSSLEQMIRLTGAKISDEIGRFGPSKAALSLDLEAPEHLRLYETLFGRDSLRVAIDLIPTYPELARTTILELARLQGVTENIEREEELGRIVHEARSPDDPIAQALSAERGWGWPYYGTVDATPEFIRVLTAYCQLSEENRGFLSEEYVDRNGETQTISHALEMALSWIQRRLNMNPEGLLEYRTPLPKGIENQVWKDSWDAYHHSDGTIANHDSGIASIEVQVTTYDALIDAAELFEDILDQPDQAIQLRSHAAILRNTILHTFWTEDKGGYFVLGTDRDPESNTLRRLEVRTSNMGHVLNSRILKGDNPEIVRMREMTIQHLFSPEMLNASGIRTLASDEYRFRPGAYHNGSVWLWDTHHISKGLRRLGYTEQADILDQKILNVAADTHIFPEYVRGDDAPVASINEQSIVVWDEINQKENKIEQPPQEIQAWTVAAILAIKRRIYSTPLIR
jgi:glycogen debranching enzyme